MRAPLLAALLLLSPAFSSAEGAFAELAAFAGASGISVIGTAMMGPAAGRRTTPVAPPQRIDLAWQWGGAFTSRDQGNLGSCTAFATVAAYEAASSREPGGACLRLSEADLYMQAVVETWPCWRDQNRSCDGAQPGFTLLQMDQFLRTHGALGGDGYRQAVGNFTAARAADARVAAESRNWLLMPLRFTNGGYTPSRLQRDLFVSFYAHSWVSRNTAARSRVANRLARFRSVRREWPVVMPGMVNAAQCRQLGQPRAAFIDGELAAGRPVAVSMHLQGLPQWGPAAVNANGPAGHAFMIRGVERLADGSRRYLTRNSWGAGHDPFVYPDQMCRVFMAVSVLAPGER